MQARQGTIQVSSVAGMSVLLLVSGVLLLCATLLIPQVRYFLVWGVGVGNVV